MTILSYAACLVVQVLLVAEKASVDVAMDTISKLKIRIEFLLTELRRKQVPHTTLGGRFEGAWLPFVPVGTKIAAGTAPTAHRERWTCCDCTCRTSFFCKPFCGCKKITQQVRGFVGVCWPRGSCGHYGSLNAFRCVCVRTVLRRAASCAIASLPSAVSDARAPSPNLTSD